MKKIFIIQLCLLCLLGVIHAQSIERAVIATSGDYHSNGTGAVSQTIGEPVGEFFTNETTHLTQGFQQGEYEMPVLPLELLDFQAFRLDEEEVELSWTIAEATNVSSIILERRINSDFIEIAQFDYEDQYKWTYIDENNARNDSYYRLKIVDVDETISFSPIREIQGSPYLHLVTVHPNPFAHSLSIMLDPDDRNYPGADNTGLIQLEIFDNGGSLLQTHEFYNSPFRKEGKLFELDNLQNLPSGMYQIVVKIGEYSETLSVTKK